MGWEKMDSYLGGFSRRQLRAIAQQEPGDKVIRSSKGTRFVFGA